MAWISKLWKNRPDASTPVGANGLNDLEERLTAGFAGKQPLNSNLTAIAELETTAIGRSLLAAVNAAAIRAIINSASLAELAVESTARETGDALALPKAGGTMTGAITLPSNPGANLQAAPKQYVDSAISALVNGAPETFDTLKEISDRLKLDEETETALIAIVAQKLAKAENLGDLPNAATARTNLGLGSAAVQPASAFQPSDEDLAKIAELATTTIGRSLLTVTNAAGIRAISEAAAAVHTHVEKDVTGLVADLENLWRQGLPAKEWPGLTNPGLFAFFGNTIQMTTAKATRASRFVPWRNMTVRGLRFQVTTAATSNDEVCVGIADSTGKVVLAVSPAAAGLLNAFGPHNLDFSADVELTGGNVYYPFLMQGTVGGTAATLTGFSVSTLANSLFFGSTTPDALTFSLTGATFPPTSLIPVYTQSNCVSLVVRER